MGKVAYIDSGEARIRELGYKQELVRNFGLISNASIGFTAISILTGITCEHLSPPPYDVYHYNPLPGMLHINVHVHFCLAPEPLTKWGLKGSAFRTSCAECSTAVFAASLSIGWTNGGPVSIVWGWILVSVMSLTVAACIAEITSSLPISGGPYYWYVA